MPLLPTPPRDRRVSPTPSTPISTSLFVTPHSTAALEELRDMRNFVAEMRAYIAEQTGDGTYVARIKAAEIVKVLADVDPDLLEGYLRQIAETVVTNEIVNRDRAQRAHSRVVARRTAFQVAAIAARGGDTSAIAGFLDNRYVLADGSRARLAELRAEDLNYVASRYEDRVRQNQVAANFLRVLARVVGDKTVGEVYDEGRLTALWRSSASDHAATYPASTPDRPPVRRSA